MFVVIPIGIWRFLLDLVIILFCFTTVCEVSAACIEYMFYLIVIFSHLHYGKLASKDTLYDISVSHIPHSKTANILDEVL